MNGAPEPLCSTVAVVLCAHAMCTLAQDEVRRAPGQPRPRRLSQGRTIPLSDGNVTAALGEPPAGSHCRNVAEGANQYGS